MLFKHIEISPVMNLFTHWYTVVEPTLWSNRLKNTILPHFPSLRKHFHPILSQWHNMWALSTEECLKGLHKHWSQLGRWALCLLYSRKRHNCIAGSLLKEAVQWKFIFKRTGANGFNTRLKQQDVHSQNPAFILVVACLQSPGASNWLLETWGRMKGRMV